MKTSINYVSKLKEIKKESSSKLEKKVINILLDRQNDYDSIIDYMKEILDHGCSSGIVGELIYYNDTLKFYAKYKNEINTMLKNSMNEMGTYSLKDIFGKNFDDSDPLLSDTHNQNLLSWYAMEETTRNLIYALGIEY
jgi:hypothetical protein